MAINECECPKNLKFILPPLPLIRPNQILVHIKLFKKAILCRPCPDVVYLFVVFGSKSSLNDDYVRGRPCSSSTHPPRIFIFIIHSEEWPNPFLSCLTPAGHHHHFHPFPFIFARNHWAKRGEFLLLLALRQRREGGGEGRKAVGHFLPLFLCQCRRCISSSIHPSISPHLLPLPRQWPQTQSPVSTAFVLCVPSSLIGLMTSKLTCCCGPPSPLFA